MTSAFLAEVDTIKGTMFVGNKGKLSKIPLFFAQSARLKKILGRDSSYRTSVDYFLSTRDAEKTRIVVVDNVEKGLRASTGVNLSVAEFLAKEYGASKYASSKPVNAVFKIRITSPFGQKVSKYSGGGKYGTTWERQGDVRLHITNNLSRLTVKHTDARVPYYKDAEVVMIELDQDGVTPTKITCTPIIDFYLQSPACKQRWTDLNRSSLASFELNPKWAGRV